MSIPGLLDAIGLVADEELVGTIEDRFIAVDFDFATTLSSPFCSCILFAIVLEQLIRILSAASRAEMADVEQMKKIVPSVTCEISFGQNVYKLMFGINVSNLNFRIKINPVKRPIQSNSVGSGHVSHCGTSAFYFFFNHGFLVCKMHCSGSHFSIPGLLDAIGLVADEELVGTTST